MLLACSFSSSLQSQIRSGPRLVPFRATERLEADYSSPILSSNSRLELLSAHSHWLTQVCWGKRRPRETYPAFRRALANSGWAEVRAVRCLKRYTYPPIDYTSPCTQTCVSKFLGAHPTSKVFFRNSEGAGKRKLISLRNWRARTDTYPGNYQEMYIFAGVIYHMGILIIEKNA